MRRFIRNKKAIVLLSGGLDSATTLYLAKAKGYKITCLIFDYGQRHKREINSALKLAKRAGCAFQIIKLALPAGSCSLLDKKISIPKPGFGGKPSMRSQIPSTYVPARNLIFLSLATSFAESIAAGNIFIGANAIDFSGYPDCRPKFYRILNRLIKAGTKAGVEGRPIKILTPLINKSKKGIIKLGKKLGVPYELTWSCYSGRSRPCRVCESCFLREKGFKEAGGIDPLEAKFAKR